MALGSWGRSGRSAVRGCLWRGARTACVRGPPGSRALLDKGAMSPGEFPRGSVRALLLAGTCGKGAFVGARVCLGVYIEQSV